MLFYGYILIQISHQDEQGMISNRVKPNTDVAVELSEQPLSHHILRKSAKYLSIQVELASSLRPKFFILCFVLAVEVYLQTKYCRKTAKIEEFDDY